MQSESHMVTPGERPAGSAGHHGKRPAVIPEGRRLGEAAVSMHQTLRVPSEPTEQRLDELRRMKHRAAAINPK
jgi:hypothetical protein